MKRLKFLIAVLIFFSSAFIFVTRVFAKDILWPIQAIDTAKYSRDNARNPETLKIIPLLVQTVSNLGANYIAIDTPYDEEFYPVLKIWEDNARKYGLHVWFRGNLSSWEGWFDYPLFTNAEQHNQKIYQFITNHPDLFQNGDIFTPAPEPENGKIIGDPRQSEKNKKAYFNFLTSSYTNCQKAFAKIERNVSCGYFSTNGDIAKYILTPTIVKKLGNTVVIDHYVKTPQQFQDDLDYLHKKFPNSEIILGEFGSPIPDINGSQTPEQQKYFVQSLLKILYEKNTFVRGVDYWTLMGGSTALINDDLSSRPVTNAIKQYYIPGVIDGKISDTFGLPIQHAIITINSIASTESDGSGQYQITAPEGIFTLNIQKAGYESMTKNVIVYQGTKTITNIALRSSGNEFSSGISNLWNVFYSNLSSFILPHSNVNINN